MIKLNNLSPGKGANRQSKRVGRGQGTGQGGTAGRGHKGARARSGYSMKAGFEGGQMPLHRRLPKGGFTNVFKMEYTIISLNDLDTFITGSTVDKAALIEAGLIGKSCGLVKVLANGEVNKALTIQVDKVSAAAREKIEAAGGTVQG